MPVVLLGTGSVAAFDVPIVNPDFESDQLPFAGADQPTITGWDTTAGGGDGIFRPTDSDYPQGIPSGENVAYVNLPGNRVRQVLTTPLAANTRYVLTVEVGWNNNDPFAGYILELRAGGEILAVDESSQMPPQGSFVTATLVFTSGASPEQLGSPLEIWLRSPGIQANFDDVRLTAESIDVCNEELVVPSFLVDQGDASGTTTLFAVRNLTGDPVTADVEYHTVDGTSQQLDVLTLGPFETRTVNLRDVAGLRTDPDGFSRGFVSVRAAGGPDGRPVLAGDFFQVDVGNNFATGDELLGRPHLCRRASIRTLDFGAGTRLAVYVVNPRGADEGSDLPSFTVQVFDEAGNPEGSPQPVWTGDHALDLAASDFTTNPFGALVLDFTNAAGGAAYAEYSAQGRFSVGVASQCEEAPVCDDCCAPGTPKATTPPLHYPEGTVIDGILIDDCEAAISDSLRNLRSAHYRNACQQAHGGAFPHRVLGARIVSCEEDPPGFNGGVVVVVEACCPPSEAD